MLQTIIRFFARIVKPQKGREKGSFLFLQETRDRAGKVLADMAKSRRGGKGYRNEKTYKLNMIKSFDFFLWKHWTFSFDGNMIYTAFGPGRSEQRQKQAGWGTPGCRHLMSARKLNRPAARGRERGRGERPPAPMRTAEKKKRRMR